VSGIAMCGPIMNVVLLRGDRAPTIPNALGPSGRMPP